MKLKIENLNFTKIIGLIAAIIAIFAFFTGIFWIGDLGKYFKGSKGSANINLNENSIYPKLDGNDVLVPNYLIENIEKHRSYVEYKYDPLKPVYSAFDFNGWLVLGNSARSKLKYSAIIKEGDYWRAKDLKNKRFHPVQIIDETLQNPFFEENIAWALIENYGGAWSKLPFVDTSNGMTKPCLCLGDKCPKNNKP